jgi:hypothetical protein
MSSWQDPSFLLSVWRRREPQLMKLLTAGNLAHVREKLSAEAAVTGKSALSVADFLRIMLKLLGSWAINKEELVIQLLDLFCNIDVNNDKVRRTPLQCWQASSQLALLTHSAASLPPHSPPPSTPVPGVG